MGARSLSLEVVDHIEPLAEEWEDLAARTYAAPFVRPGWIRAWRGAFGRGGLLILAVRRSGRLVALLPLERRGGVVRSPTNPHSPSFGLLAEDAEAAQSLTRALFAHAGRAVVLEYLDPVETGLDLLREAAHATGYRDMVQTVARSPYILGHPIFAEYERSLSRNLRHDVERRLRRLSEIGAVSVDVRDGSERLDTLLEEGFRVEQIGWKSDHGTAIASRPQTRRFYTDVAHWAASAGWLRLAFLRLDGRPLAFQLDLEAEDTYYSLKIGYDPAYERFSPGKLLTHTMVSRAMSKGLASYELLGADEPWKHRWTDTSRERVALRAFASSPTGYLAWSAFVHGRSFARRVPFA
jgi:CelD/BcsL family acetyltransferase involved in cellulose biosynthesis